jgi:hypothetical protein
MSSLSGTRKVTARVRGKFRERLAISVKFELTHDTAGQSALFFVWPTIGFVGAIAGGWSQLEWLAPLGMGGLFCHYWLDGRIWTQRSLENRHEVIEKAIAMERA